MKKLFLIIFLFSFFASNAQRIEVKKSTIYKEKQKTISLEYSLIDDDGGIVVIKAYYAPLVLGPAGYYIEYFDKNLTPKKKIKYKPESNHILKNAFVKDGQLHLIEYAIDKKEKKISFNVLSSDVKSLDFSSKEILTISSKDQGSIYKMLIPPILQRGSSYDGDYTGQVIISRDKKYIAINFDINKENNEVHRIFVFNDNFKKLYEQEINLDIKDRLFQFMNIDIDDNTGEVYFLGKAFEGNKLKSKLQGKSNFHYEVFKVNAEGLKNNNLNDDEHFITSLVLVRKNDGLYCIGFYGDNNMMKTNGVCFFKIDPNTMEIEISKFNPFTEQFLEDRYGKIKEGRKERIQKKGIKDIIFKNISILENGDFVVNGEEYYITTMKNLKADGTYSGERVIRHFDDIISLRISKNGDLIWARDIVKKQSASNPILAFSQSLSFTSLSVGNKTYLFVNNGATNLKKLSDNRLGFIQTKNVAKAMTLKPSLYAVVIDGDGMLKIEKILDGKDADVYVYTNSGVVDEKHNSVIFIGMRQKKTRLIKVSIK